MQTKDKLQEIIVRTLIKPANKKMLHEQVPHIKFVDSEDEPVEPKTDKTVKPKVPFKTDVTPKPKTDVTPTKTDRWGRKSDDPEYGFDIDAFSPTFHTFVEGPNTGKTWKQVYPNEPEPKSIVTPDITAAFQYEFNFNPTGNYKIDGKTVNGYQMRAHELYRCKSFHIFGLEWFSRDEEELYPLLITGTTDQRKGKNAKGETITITKFRGIQSKEEWERVDDALRIESKKGIIAYANSFVRSTERAKVFKPIFNKIGELFGAERLKREIENLPWLEGMIKTDNTIASPGQWYGIDKIWEQYRNDLDQKMTDKEKVQADLDQIDDEASDELGLVTKTTLAVIIGGVIGAVSLIGLYKKLFGNFKPIRNWLDRRAVDSMNAQGLQRLHVFIGQQRTAGTITEAEYKQWLRFYRQRSSIFKERYEELESLITKVEQGTMTLKGYYEELESLGINITTNMKTTMRRYAEDSGFVVPNQPAVTPPPPPPPAPTGRQSRRAKKRRK